MQCRLCMRVMDNNLLEDIFKNNEFKIADQIFDCTSLVVSQNDTLSQKICQNCKSILGIMTHFKSSCLKTNQLMLDHFMMLEGGDWVCNSSISFISQCEELIVSHKNNVNSLYESVIKCDHDDQQKIKEEERLDLEEDVSMEDPIVESCKTSAESPVTESKTIKPKRVQRSCKPQKNEQILCNLCAFIGPSDSAEVELTSDEIKLFKDLEEIKHSRPKQICNNCSILVRVVRTYQSVYLDNKESEHLKPLKELLDKQLAFKSEANKAMFNLNITLEVNVVNDVSVPLLGFESNTSQLNNSPTPTVVVEVEKVAKSKNAANLACHVCGKLYSKTKLKYHLNVHENNREYKCDIENCSSAFFRPEDAKKHKLLRHTDYFYKSCTVCGKKLKTLSDLRRHMPYHDEPKIPCKVCGKCLYTNESMRKHLRTHSEEKPLSCTFCGKRFFEAYALSVHTRIHTNEKPFPCTQCDMKFAYNCLLKNHIEKLHPE